MRAIWLVRWIVLLVSASVVWAGPPDSSAGLPPAAVAPDTQAAAAASSAVLEDLVTPADAPAAKKLSGVLRELAAKALQQKARFDATGERLSGNSRFGDIFLVDRGTPIVDVTVADNIDAIAAEMAIIDGVIVSGKYATAAYGQISAAVPVDRLVDVARITGVRSIHASAASKSQIASPMDRDRLRAQRQGSMKPSIETIPIPHASNGREYEDEPSGFSPRGGMLPPFQGVANNQSLQGLRLNQARLVYPALGGNGIDIGAISDTVNRLDSFVDANCGGANCIGIDESQFTGDLPPDTQIVVVQDGALGADEGRAMLEHIFDLAPSVNRLGFATALNGEAAFATNIGNLSASGMDVIVDDVVYLGEPYYQDGVVAQAVNTYVAGGGVYLSINHNYANLSYENLFSSTDGDDYHDYLPGDEVQQITLAPGMTLFIGLQWSQPWGNATTDLQLQLWDAAVATQLAASTEANVGGNPLDLLNFTNNTMNPMVVNVAVLRTSGSIAGLTFKYIFFDNGASQVTINEYAANAAGTLTPHAATQQSISIGAAPFWNINAAEPFSGIGPHRRFFTAGGSPSAAVLTKPDFLAIDNCNNTFFGADVAQDADAFPNFPGTSAAAPNTAAICALMLQGAGGPGALSQQQIKDILRVTAVDLGAAGHDFTFGHGRVDALGAIAASVGPEFSEFTLYPNQFGDASVSLSIDSIADTDRVEFASDDLGQTTVSVTETNSLDPMVLVFNDQPNLVAADYNGGFDIDDALATFDVDFWDVHTAKVLAENNFTPPGAFTLSLNAPDQFVGFVTVDSTFAGSTSSAVSAVGDLDYFRITAPVNLPPNLTTLEVASVPTGFDGIVIAFDAAGYQIAVGDGIGGGVTDALVVPGIGPGDEIVLLVCAWSYSGSGAYNMSVQFAPFNDDCGDSIVAGIGATAFANHGATTGGPSTLTACAFEAHNDIWYRHVATCTGQMTVSLCGSAFDTVLAVYEGDVCPTSPFPDVCNDQFCGDASEVTLAVTAGQSYMIRIGGWNGSTGTGTMSISCTPEGACCDGSTCTIGTQAACAGLGGIYQGDATTCQPGLCTSMGVCPGVGNCFDSNGTVGCNDQSCCDAVCILDPYCCATEWDDVCANRAKGYCNDCNSNSIPDYADLQELNETDCNGNGIPDRCETASREAPDCNGNDLPDECDIETGLRPWAEVLLRCDENGGATVFDFSGNGHDGANSGVTWVNQTPFAMPGNYSLRFDHERDAVTIPAPPGGPLDMFDKLTLAAFINPQDTAGLHFILWADDGPFSLQLNNNSIVFGLNNQTLIVHPFRATGIWTHVATTYDGAIARLYVNGAEVAATNAALGAIGPVQSRDIIRVGNDETADFSGFNRDFRGLIDRVMISKTALSPAEMLYEATHSLLAGSSGDCNSNGAPDECESDTDGDGLIDPCDACPQDNPDDTDADGVCDSDDICPGFNDMVDPDGDETPTGCDPCPQDNPDDSDADGVCDSADLCPGFDDNVDSDADGIADGCDVCPGFDDSADADADSVPDGCDRCPGFDDTQDSDADAIPDACDRCGDFDGDLSITSADYDQMPMCMGGAAAAPSPSPPLTAPRCLAAFDCDLDGDVDLADFDDIQRGYDGP